MGCVFGPRPAGLKPWGWNHCGPTAPNADSLRTGHHDLSQGRLGTWAGSVASWPVRQNSLGPPNLSGFGSVFSSRLAFCRLLRDVPPTCPQCEVQEVAGWPRAMVLKCTHLPTSSTWELDINAWAPPGPVVSETMEVGPATCVLQATLLHTQLTTLTLCVFISLSCLTGLLRGLTN